MAEDRRAGSTTQGDRTRERIVVAAADLMYANGVAATRLQDVQDVAGASPSQIYHYFASKADLVRAVIAYRGDTIADAQRTALSSATSIDDLERWAERVLAAQEQAGFRGGCPIGSLSSELANSDEATRIQVTRAFAEWSDALRDSIVALQGSGAIPGDQDVDDLATTLLATVQGALLLSQAEGSGQPLRTALSGMIGLLQSAGANP